MGEGDRGTIERKKQGRNSDTEREGMREEQHSGYGFHHSESCWLGVGEWEASSPIWCMLQPCCVSFPNSQKSNVRRLMGENMGTEERLGGGK